MRKLLHTRSGALLVLGLAFLTAAGCGAVAVNTRVNRTAGDGVAIGGYDPVAYFTDGRAAEGSVLYEQTWRGATWRFASERNMHVFMAGPVRYSPQYGGYCARAMARGELVPAEPRFWVIADDRLFLLSTPNAFAEWQAQARRLTPEADANWQRLSPALR